MLTINTFDAQLVVKNDTLSGTPLSMTMDKKIGDLLVNIEEKCATTITNNSGKSWSAGSDSSSNSNIPKINVPEKELSQAEICRRNPRIMGYKIQLAVVKSNEEAREVGMYFRRRFPNMKVEIDASLRPNYKVMAGSYLSKQTASSDFSSVQKTFKEARLIPYRVFCVEAK
ncbi:sporulation protein [Kaistella jeonii]|uniref:Sporulation protein n=1 Tax=Kaistella jeonii TaxID=266749 RepID=A0A0C1FQT2_9FLAO|nr:sporulation protein [Kaistella jeonii]